VALGSLRACPHLEDHRSLLEVTLELRASGARATSTDARRRRVDLLPVLRDELVGYRSRRMDAAATDLVFPTTTGGPQNRNNVQRRILLRAVTSANERLAETGKSPIPEGTTPHSLRRTFASLRLATGDEVPYVMQQLAQRPEADARRLRAGEVPQGRRAPAVVPSRRCRRDGLLHRRGIHGAGS
jgi:integrase